ncbi:MAG: hypothetical protein R6U64_09215 [Bacteroidales bacterium]
MKKLIFTSILAFLLAGAGMLKAQNRPDEYLGLPGDNLNLFAVMNLFQESETLEGFERSLNDPDQMVNNLDLNGDNLVDYIMVYDYVEGNVHSIVLRVALNKKEQQDVAVFTVWKMEDGTAQIQLIGDEALYGPDYIVEPIYAETPNPGYRGEVASSRNVVRTTYYEVATWPVIVYISRPVYRPWRSVWYWGYYPGYWNPWTPHYYHAYYGYHYNWHDYYYAHYRPWNHYRTRYYHNYYYSNHRHYSQTVVINVNKGNYKQTYSRPESRKEGERLFAQRKARGGNVPGNGSVNADRRRDAKASPAVSNGRSRTSERQAPSVTRGDRSGKGENVRTRPAQASPRVSSGRSARTSGNEKVGTRPAQASPRNSSPRSTRVQENRNSGRQSAPAVNRTSTRSTRNAPAVNRSSSNRKESAPAVKRQATERRESSRVSAPRTNSRTKKQPAAVKSAPSRNSKPAATRVKTTERSTRSKPAAVKSNTRTQKNNSAARPTRPTRK